MRHSHSVAIAGATLMILGSGSPLPAQSCRLCSQSTSTTAKTDEDANLTVEIETNLNFDRLVLAAAGQGAALVRPDGSRLAEGSIAAVSGRAMVGTAVVHGVPGRAVRIELPGRIDLYSTAGGRLGLDELTTDAADVPRLDTTGNLTFHFGGRITVTGDADGNYRGEMPITVEYQ